MVIVNRFKNAEDKEAYVQGVFTRVAKRYDLINSLISFNRDAYWRRVAVNHLNMTANSHIIDVACGTCKLTEEILKQVGTAQVQALDFNADMLEIGRDNIAKIGKADHVDYTVGDAMQLPFKDNTFDGAISGFALRNVPDIPTVLREMKRVVKPGGMVVTLELAKPEAIGFKQMYNFYFEHIMPLIGRMGSHDSSYKWLCESWMGFMHQDELRDLFTEIGLEDAGYQTLTGGVVAVHYGRVPNE